MFQGCFYDVIDVHFLSGNSLPPRLLKGGCGGALRPSRHGRTIQPANPVVGETDHPAFNVRRVGGVILADGAGDAHLNRRLEDAAKVTD